MDEDFAANIVNKELLSQIEEYVCSLDPALQEIFHLRLYGDYSFPEIASETSQPESKIKAQYYRLIQKLRKEFSFNA